MISAQSLVVKVFNHLVILEQFLTPCSLVTMSTHDLRFLYIEVSGQGLRKKSENLGNQLGTLYEKTGY